MARDFKNTKNTSLVGITKKISDNIELIEIEKLIENENNEFLFGMESIPDLAKSIETNGFRGAIEVYDLENGFYEIASGHRRKRAMEYLEKKEIPCIVKPKYKNEIERGIWLLDSNLKQRGGIKGFDPVHVSRMICWFDKTIYSELKLFNPNTPPKKVLMNEKFGISESVMYKYMAISQYINPIQDKIKKGLPFSALYGIQNESEEIQEKINESLDDALTRIGYDNVTTSVVADIVKKIIAEKNKESTVVDIPDIDVVAIQKKRYKTFVSSCTKLSDTLKRSLSYGDKADDALKILKELSAQISEEMDRISEEAKEK